MGIGEILKISFKRLKENYKILILSILAFLVVNLGLTFAYAIISALFGIIPVLRYFTIIFYLVLVAVELPLANAFLKQTIKISNGEETKPFDFLGDFGGLFKISWKVAFRTFLKYWVPIAVIILSMIFAATGITALVLIGVIGYIYGLISFIIATLSYVFVNNEMIYDNGNSTAKQIVENSAEYMNGHKANLFLLYILCGAIYSLTSLSFIIPVLGVLVLLCVYFLFLPYQLVLMIAFYENARGTLTDDNDQMINSINNVIENENNVSNGPIIEENQNIDSNIQ